MRRFTPILLLLALVACSNQGTRPPDTVVPGRVTDLLVTGVEDSTVTIAWTAPGSDGQAGRAAAYEVRWLSSQITEPDWSAGVPVGPLPVPGVAGTRESAVLRGVPGGAWRYLALKARDDSGNWSIISNSVSAWTGAPACRAVPDSIDFGRVLVGEPFDLEFVLRNDGGGTLRGDITLASAEFVLVSGGGTAVLLHGGHQTVRVRFTPGETGTATARVETGTACGAVPCVGSGILAGAGMVPISAGDIFDMGSPATEAGHDTLDERRHPVQLTRGFDAGIDEVTQAEWAAVMGWNDSAFPGADRPVETITWFDAIDYCNRLSERDGLEAVYDLGNIARTGDHIARADVVWDSRRDGYRLPTEAEWEYAARAGTTGATPGGEPQVLGCEPPDPVLAPVAWYCGNAPDGTRPIGGLAANPWGLDDVFGNVFEWTWDFYDPQYGLEFPPVPTEPLLVTDPTGPGEGPSRVCRGGSWNVTPRECRSAYRLYHPPGNVYSDVGLRIVRTRR